MNGIFPSLVLEKKITSVFKFWKKLSVKIASFCLPLVPFQRLKAQEKGKVL